MTTNTTTADKMSEEVQYDRRRFLSTAVMSIAAAQLGMASFATHNPAKQSRQIYPPLSQTTPRSAR